nr:glycosyltransferase family 39 protein [Halorussus halophilus]
MPFYDLFSALFYVPTSPFLGVRAVTVFSLIVSCVSVLVFYPAARRFFDERAALYATTLYALYPKLLVLTAKGYPEASAVGIIVISTYALGTSRERNGAPFWSVVAGVTATFSYLLYVPAVLYGILTAAFVQLDSRIRTPVEGSRLRALSVPTTTTVLYVLPPFVVGVLYLVFGPLQKILTTASADSGTAVSSLFVDPDSYGVMEKVVRYVAYEYFDFWWHLRGFDKEKHVLGTVEKLQNFLGDAFWIFFGGWTGITLFLTVIICIGIGAMAKRRKPADVYVLGIGAVYLVALTFRNAGWVGAFQTRHVFPLFFAVTLTFGVGAARLVEWGKNEPLGQRYATVTNRLNANKLVHLLVVLGLVALVANGGVNAYLAGQNDRVSKEAPITELTAVAASDDTVAVASLENYWWSVLYSEGEVWPVLWVNTSAAEDTAKSRTVRADIQVHETNEPLTGTDLLYLSNPCGPLNEYQQTLADTAVERGGSIVINRSRSRGTRCRVTAVLVELPE